METATEAYGLIEKGGIVAVLLLGLIVLGIAFVSGAIVPRWMYKEKRDSEAKAIQLAKDIVEAVKELTIEVRELRGESYRRGR